MTDDVDRNRRHFLAVATAVTGGAGIALASIPFISSLKPSARAEAQGAPVEVAVGSLEPGEMIRVLWRGRLVFVLMRTSLLLSSADHPPRCILITSALPSEGKTVTAVNTAISLSQTGNPGRRGFVYPSGMRTSGTVRGRTGRGLVWRILLSLSWFEIRSLRPRL